MSARAEYQRAYYLANRDRLRANHKAYRERNRAALAEREAAWRQANPERVVFLSKRWHDAHPADPVRAARLKRQRRQANPEAHAIEQSNRRAAKLLGTVVPITTEALAQRRAFLGERCYVCGASARLTWDHVKPLKAGGLHVLANLRLACVSCNSRKGARWTGVTGLPSLLLSLRLALAA